MKPFVYSLLGSIFLLLSSLLISSSSSSPPPSSASSSFTPPSSPPSPSAFSSLFTPHCTPYDIDDLQSLRSILHSRIVGQERAVSDILSLIESRYRNNNIQTQQRSGGGYTGAQGDTARSKKPLVFSFHGLTGIGKTLVSSIISNTLYYEGSHAVRRFHCQKWDNHEINTDPSLRTKVLHSILYDIKMTLSYCPQAVIIFEEISYLPYTLLDDIAFLFEEEAAIDEVAGDQAIYIFTSNVGGQELQQLSFVSEIDHNVERSKISQDLIDQTIIKALQTYHRDADTTGDSDGGNDNNKKSTHPLLTRLISNSLINHFVPFFPLYQSPHVRQCVLDELNRVKSLSITNKEFLSIKWTNKELNWLAESASHGQHISPSGCRHVSDIVAKNFMGPIRDMNRLVETRILWGLVPVKRWELRHKNILMELEEFELTKDQEGWMERERIKVKILPSEEELRETLRKQKEEETQKEKEKEKKKGKEGQDGRNEL